MFVLHFFAFIVVYYFLSHFLTFLGHSPTFLVIFSDFTLVHFLSFLVDHYDDNLKLGDYDKQILVNFLFSYFKDIFFIFMSYFE